MSENERSINQHDEDIDNDSAAESADSEESREHQGPVEYDPVDIYVYGFDGQLLKTILVDETRWFLYNNGCLLSKVLNEKHKTNQTNPILAWS